MEQSPVGRPPMRRIPRRAAALRVLVAVLLTLVVLLFSAAFVGGIAALRPNLGQTYTWLSGLLNHTAMLGISFVMVLVISGGRLERYGMRMPSPYPIFRSVRLAVAVSALAFAVGRALRLEGLTFLEEYTLLQGVLLIWIWASIAEEVFLRGLILGYLAPLGGYGWRIGPARFSLPVLVSAGLFALIHLLLLTLGIAPSTVAFVVFFAFFVGLLAGFYRERSGSVLPAILVHSAANATGAILETLIGS